jgi:hypothetical protein
LGDSRPGCDEGSLGFVEASSGPVLVGAVVFGGGLVATGGLVTTGGLVGVVVGTVVGAVFVGTVVVGTVAADAGIGAETGGAAGGWVRRRAAARRLVAAARWCAAARPVAVVVEPESAGTVGTVMEGLMPPGTTSSLFELDPNEPVAQSARTTIDASVVAAGATWRQGKLRSRPTATS